MSGILPSPTDQVGVLYINTDGGSRGNPGAAAIGVVAKFGGQVVFEKAATIGVATNNTAEYTAVIQAMNWLKNWIAGTAEGTKPLPNPPQSVQFRLDSQLVVEQLMGHYKVKQPHILSYVRQIRADIQSLPLPVRFGYVPRAQNARADELVNEALDAEAQTISSD